jgi:hypothetical protein
MGADWVCECSEDFGPCEYHCDTLVQRAGASSRTADELAMVFVDDLLELGAKLTDHRDLLLYGEAEKALEDGRDKVSGCAWIEDPDIAQGLVELGERLEQTLEDVWVFRDDGYVIVRPHNDCPLVR